MICWWTFIISRLKIKLENINNIFEAFRNRTAFLFVSLPISFLWIFCCSQQFPCFVLRLQQRSYCWPSAMTTANFQVTMRITNSKLTTITARWESMPQSSWILEAGDAEHPKHPGCLGWGKGIVILIWQSSHLEDPLDNVYIYRSMHFWHLNQMDRYIYQSHGSCELYFNFRTTNEWMKWTRMRCITILRRETSTTVILWQGKVAFYMAPW